MNKDNPRWLHEIPGIKITKDNKRKEITNEEKREIDKESKEFEDAVRSGNIEQWFPLSNVCNRKIERNW